MQMPYTILDAISSLEFIRDTKKDYRLQMEHVSHMIVYD